MTAEQGKKGEGPKLEDEAPDDDDAPPSDVRRATTVTDEELRAFLALPDTQAQIRKIVLARIRGKVSDVEVEDLVQEASVAVLTSTSRPKSMTTAMGWLGLVTARAVFDHFRRNKSRRQSLVLEDDVDAFPADDEPKGGFAPDWLVTRWLADRVASSPRHQATYELLLYKARNNLTLAQVAEKHCMTEGALKSRIHTLKMDYQPQWKRRERMFILVILLGIGLVVAIGWLAWDRERTQPPARPAPAPTSPSFLDRVFGGPPLVGHAPPDDPASRAAFLRDDAKQACAARDWKACTDALDQAAALDPKGDESAEVKAMRKSAEEGKP